MKITITFSKAFSFFLILICISSFRFLPANDNNNASNNIMNRISSSEIIISEIVITCDDNGTPTDPSDDFSIINFSASLDGNPNGQYTANDGTIEYGPFFYNETIEIIQPPDGTIYTVFLFDIIDNSCSTVGQFGPLYPCSDNNNFDITCTVVNNVSVLGASDGQANINITDLTLPPQAPYNIQYQGNVLVGSLGDNSLTGLSAGTYTVIVTFGSESQTCSFTITEPDQTFDCATIYSTAIASCPANSNNDPDDCEQVCANTTVTYTFADYDPNLSASDIIWTIEGADTYTTDGNTAVVTWGEAGTGQVSAMFPTEEPLTILCSEFEAATDPTIADGTGVVNIFGGVAPYNISVFGSFGSVYVLLGVEGGAVFLPELFVDCYTVEVTDASGQVQTCDFCINTSCNDLNVNVNIVSDIYCYGECSGALDIDIFGGTPPYIWEWSSSLPPFPTNLCAGTYTLTVTDANGCSVMTSVSITEPEEIILVCEQSTPISVPGGSDGEANINISGGIPPYTIWGGGVTINATVGDNILTGLSAGAYSIVVTDGNGCEIPCSVTIDPVLGMIVPFDNDILFQQLSKKQHVDKPNELANQKLQTITGNITNANCILGVCDGAIDVTVTGLTPPLTYDWFVDSFDGIEDPIGLCQGSYVLTVTDANGNSESTLFTIECLSPIEITGNITNASGDADCCNGGIDLTITGGNPPYVFTWSNNVTSEDLFNLCSGSYIITVYDDFGNETIAEFGVGCTPSDLTITGQVTNATQAGDCCDGAIDITVQGGFAPYTFDWPNGTNTEDLSNLCEGTHILTVTDANGFSQTESFTVTCNNNACMTMATLCVNILENPEALYHTTPPAIQNEVNICQGQTVYFESLSTGTENNIWHFGTVDDLEGILVSQTFEDAGTFIVKLIAQNACLCSDTTDITVIVDPAIVPDVGCVGTVCANESVTYTTSADCGAFYWNVTNGDVIDGGNESDNFISVDWGAGPVGTVELAVESCSEDYCDVTSVYQIPILSETTTITGPTKVCPGITASYSIPDYGGSSFDWSVSSMGTIVDGQGTSEISVEWPHEIPPATQWVAVDFGNCYLDCSGTGMLDVNVRPPFYIEGDIEACAGASSTYTAQTTEFSSNPVICNWIVLDGSGGTFFTSASPTSTINLDWDLTLETYTLLATPADPDVVCIFEARKQMKLIDIPPSPLSINGIEEICAGQTYTYEAVGVLPGNQGKWYITNGALETTSPGSSLNITWGNNPPYILALAQISGEGLPCESTRVEEEYFPIELLEINGTSEMCIEETTSYSATVYEDLEYSWATVPTDAGTIISGQGTENVEIIWHISGNANVTASVCGLFDSYPVNVRAVPQPFAIHPPSLCPSATSNVSTAEVYSTYQWFNENGSLVSALSNPTLGPGNYELVVSDDLGCEGDTLFQILALPTPEIHISTPGNTGYCLDDGDFGPTLYANNTEEGYSYQWYFNGTMVGTDASNYSNNAYGNYWVVITDINGCTATSNSVNQFEFCEPIGGGICNGGTCTLPNDCPDTTLVSFYVESTPICNVSNYNNNSAQAINMFWDFDDPNSGSNNYSSEVNPSHTFSEAGFYVVILTANIPITGEPLCWHAEVDTVYVVANFKAEKACEGSQAVFTDLSTFVPITSIASWDWNFGDPSSGVNNSSTEQHPNHLYSTAGTYTVTLLVTDQGGCTSEVSHEVEVREPPMASFTQPIENCVGAVLDFNFTGASNITSVEWDFGDPSSGAANNAVNENTLHAFDQVGNYTVTIFATDIFTCTNSYSEIITIGPNPLAGDITADPDSPICEGDVSTLTAPPGGTNWEWSDATTNDNITVDQNGVYEVTVSDSDGCSYSPPPLIMDVLPLPAGTIRIVEVDEFGNPIDYVYEDYGICEGEDVYLEIIGSGDYSYTWNNNETGEQISFTEDKENLLEAGTYEFTVMVTDNVSGCSIIEGPLTVTIYALPGVTISSSPNGILCNNEIATISIDNPQSELQYFWSNGALGNSITTGTPGDYTVRAINSNGCENTSNKISILTGPQIQKIPTGCHTRCAPDTFCLPDIPNIVSYQWYLDDVEIPSPAGNMINLQPQESGVYNVLLTDNQGCTAISGDIELDLLPGYGTIDGYVYFDINENGIIDAADTLMNDISIMLMDGTTLLDNVQSNEDGIYAFANILSTTYTLEIDDSSLPPSTQAYIIVQDTTLIGCDDEVEINWLVHLQCTIEGTSVEANICPDDTYDYNGSSYPINTDTDITLLSYFGCDSMVNLVVNSFDTYDMIIEVEACEGNFYDYDGTQILAGTSETFTFNSIEECDSMVTVQVNTLITNQIEIQIDTCDTDVISYNGEILEVPGIYTFPFTNQYSCDSTVTLTVTSMSNPLSEIQLEVCPGELALFAEQNLRIGLDTTFVFTNIDGCDSLVNVNVISFPTYTYETNGNLLTCWNDNDGTISIENITGGTQPFDFSLDNEIYNNLNTFSNLNAGNYTVYIQDGNDCMQSTDFTVNQIDPLGFEIDNTVIACEEDSIKVGVNITNGNPLFINYLWENGSTDPFTHFYNPILSWLEISNECETIQEQVHITLANDDREDFIYMSNAFSPNLDGQNDIYYGFAGKNVEVLSFEMHIYNRWGTELFACYDINDGWDGFFKEKLMDTGVYVWWYEATVFTCNRRLTLFDKGDVTIMK